MILVTDLCNWRNDNSKVQ